MVYEPMTEPRACATKGGNTANAKSARSTGRGGMKDGSAPSNERALRSSPLARRAIAKSTHSLRAVIEHHAGPQHRFLHTFCWPEPPV